MLCIKLETKNAGITQVGRVNKETSKGAPSTKNVELKINSEGNSYKRLRLLFNLFVFVFQNDLYL